MWFDFQKGSRNRTVQAETKWSVPGELYPPQKSAIWKDHFSEFVNKWMHRKKMSKFQSLNSQFEAGTVKRN